MAKGDGIANMLNGVGVRKLVVFLLHVDHGRKDTGTAGFRYGLEEIMRMEYYEQKTINLEEHAPRYQFKYESRKIK